MKAKTQGFTIVELLIAIAVIAILATISVIAYSGIQERAQRTAIAAKVKQYAAIFENYAAINGRFPSANWQCIGGSTGLPAVDGYAEGYCFKPNVPNGDNPSSAAVEAAIAQVSSNPPSPIIPEVQYNSTYTYRGLIFDAESGSNSQGGVLRAVINYYIKGYDKPCPVGNKIGSNSTLNWTRCDYPLSTNSFGR